MPESRARDTARAAKPKADHPPTSTMISEVIRKLSDKNGSSLQAIKKAIAESYDVDMKKLAPHMKKALKKGVELGTITQTKGRGASGSFKLAQRPKAEKAVVPKSVVTKAVVPSKEIKPKAVKVITEKKHAAKLEEAKKPTGAKVTLPKATKPKTSAPRKAAPKQ